MADVISSGCESSNSLELQLGCKKVSNFSVVQFSGFCKATIPSYSLPVASWCYMWHHTDTRTWWSGRKRLCLDHLRISSFGLSQSLKAHSIVYQSWFNSSSNHVLPWLGISPFWERPSMARVGQFCQSLGKDFGKPPSGLSSKRTSEEEAVCSLPIRHGFLNVYFHRIGWWENLQETPIFDGKNHGFL